MFIFLIKLVISSQFDDDMRWGTYKPQLVHAISQRNLKTYNPITAAILYYNPNFTSIQDIVYKVPELDTENVKFKILNHNGKNLNVQEITDPYRNVSIVNKWIKFPQEAKINWVDQTEVKSKSKLNILYAFTIEQFNPSEYEDRYFNYTIQQNGIHIWTQNEDQTSIEGFFVNILINNQQPDYKDIQIIKLFQGYDVNWDARHGLYKFLKDGTQQADFPNLILINVNASLENVVVIQVQQSSKLQPQEYFRDLDLLVTTLSNRDRILFKKMFGTQNECARASLANLMQGLQFTYGDLLCTVKRENCIDRKGILTHTPSRLGFPRPFLWDEGFHNIVACRINPDNCLQSLVDWVNTMSSDGWIPREQPRNDELRSYIPFLYEDPRESNPPTFFFDFEYLLRNPTEEVKRRIGQIYPKLKLWYQSWFKTQAVYENNQFTGNLKWWGPDERSNLGSGLDDWPRSYKEYVSKYNIDAQAWGYFFCQEMSRLAQLYDSSFVEELEFRKNLIKLNTKIYMQDPFDGLFKDILYIKNQEGSDIFSPHRGYPNLIPIGLGMVDKSDVSTIKSYLNFMSDPQAIWTKYGLRSLEVTNEYFGVGSNYWRGPIWINIQYLVLRGLKTYYWEVDGVQDFYYKLRKVLTNTVCNQYESRGYFYEHYNQDLDGQGKGNRPFSNYIYLIQDGWTSLITMIIAEQY